jgi:hypothetical protein
MMKTGITIDPLGIVTEHEFQDSDEYPSDNTQRIHEMIGGYLESVSTPMMTMFVNEDGRRLNLPINYVASMIARQPILGTVVILGSVNRNGDTVGLTIEQIEAAQILVNDWRSSIALHN